MFTVEEHIISPRPRTLAQHQRSERDRIRHAQVRHTLNPIEADERRLRDRQRRRNHRFPVTSVEAQERERANKHIKKSYEKNRELLPSDDNLDRVVPFMYPNIARNEVTDLDFVHEVFLGTLKMKCTYCGSLSFQFEANLC